jgi:tetratricopeptide (TPR) repeat protein
MLERIAILLLGLAAALPCVGETPSRAERLQDWRGRLERAAAHGDTDPAIALYRSILDDAAVLDENGLLVARAVDGLADIYRVRHRFDLAAPLYERSSGLLSKLLGPAQPRYAITRHNLGICYVELERWDEAERVLREALELWSAGNDTNRTAETEKALRAALERRTLPWN